MDLGPVGDAMRHGRTARPRGRFIGVAISAHRGGADEPVDISGGDLLGQRLGRGKKGLGGRGKKGVRTSDPFSS